MDAVTSTTGLTCTEELVVHALESCLVESGILAPHDETSKRVECENNSALLNLTIEDTNTRTIVSKLLSVDLEGQAASCCISSIAEQNGKHVRLNLLVVVLCGVVLHQTIEVGRVCFEQVLMLLVYASVCILKAEVW